MRPITDSLACCVIIPFATMMFHPSPLLNNTVVRHTADMFLALLDMGVERPPDSHSVTVNAKSERLKQRPVFGLALRNMVASIRRAAI